MTQRGTHPDPAQVLALLARHRTIRRFRDGPLDDALVRAAVAERAGAFFVVCATRAYYLERGGKPHTWRGGVAGKFEAPRREHLYDFYASKGVRWR